MKRVLITAGASGIGEAMAHAFELEGSKVWITDINPDYLNNCPQSWEKTHVDSSDETGMRKLFSEIETHWGGLDAICANAGIAGPTAVVEDIELNDWQRCVSVNLEGAFLAAKYGGPMLKETKGAIVLTSSTAGIYGFPNLSLIHISEPTRPY